MAGTRRRIKVKAQCMRLCCCPQQPAQALLLGDGATETSTGECQDGGLCRRAANDRAITAQPRVWRTSDRKIVLQKLAAGIEENLGPAPSRKEQRPTMKRSGAMGRGRSGEAIATGRDYGRYTPTHKGKSSVYAPVLLSPATRSSSSPGRRRYRDQHW